MKQFAAPAHTIRQFIYQELMWLVRQCGRCIK